MDRIKIGNFIALRRREKQITQEQLAEMLGITNKAVSKWENGSCLPDASLYEPLCAILEISIGELFAGELGIEADPRKDLTRMLARRLYRMGDRQLSFSEFENALSRISELTVTLKSFETKAAAVDFLSRESGFPADTCAAAYDFYTGLFADEEQEDTK